MAKNTTKTSTDGTQGVRRSAITPMNLSDSQRRVVDEFGQLYARYGMTPTFGRVFALLLVSDSPLSLDEIVVQLGISKTQASVATRDLERVGGANRLSTRGSRRILYEASDNFESIFEAQFNRVRESLEKLKHAEQVLQQGRGRDRLVTMKELHEFWLDETQDLMTRWRAKQKK